MKNQFILIQTTYQSLETAKNLARILLTEKLAACVEFSEIESNYIWQGEIKNEREILVTIKSKAELYQKIEKTIVENHDYEIPQVIAININQGFKPYMEWLSTNCVWRG